MKIMVNGKPYDSPKSFTLGETRLIQSESGATLVNLDQVIASGNPDAIAALIFILMRRQNPTVTMAEVDALDIATIEFVSEPDDAGGQSPPAVGAPPSPGVEPRQEERVSETTLDSSGAPE